MLGKIQNGTTLDLDLRSVGFLCWDREEWLLGWTGFMLLLRMPCNEVVAVLLMQLTRSLFTAFLLDQLCFVT